MKKFGILLVLILGWAVGAWSQDCKPADVYLRAVKIYIDPPQGKPDLNKAEQQLTEALRCYPENGEVQYTAGLVFSKKREYAKMTAALNAAIKHSAKFRPQAETLKAVVFQEAYIAANELLNTAQNASKEEEKTKHLQETIVLYHGCLAIDSTASGPYKNLAYVYYSLGNKDSSKHYGGLAYKFAPDSLSAKWGYAYAVDWVNEGKYREGIEILEKAVKRDSAFWDAWGLLGQLYEVENRLPEMVAAYRRLSAQFPDSAEFLKQLATYYLRSGFNAKVAAEAKKHYQEADTLFAQYLSKNPADSSAWYNRGLALLSLKDFAKAAKVLEKTVEKFPSYADAWEGLSGAYAQMGNKAEEAKKAFERSKKLRGETGGK